jgi:hypothetical protein
MNLLEMQRRMLAAVMLPLTADDGMQEANEAGERMERVAAEFMQPNDRLTAFERLEIYNRQYWFRLLNAFAEDFPALRAVVGQKRFDALAVEYLRANPSRSFTLRNLGSGLVEWLRAHGELGGRRQALAVDVARVEWACVEAFDNAQRDPLTAEEIVGLGADSRLDVQAHVQLLALEYAADEVVLAMHGRERRGASEAGARHEFGAGERERLVLGRRKTWLVVHRVEGSLYYRRITREEYQTLEGLRAGKGLAEALEAGFGGSRMAAGRRPGAVRGWFGHWAELGWLCRAGLG